jgi:hypothetical protein
MNVRMQRHRRRWRDGRPGYGASAAVAALCAVLAGCGEPGEQTPPERPAPSASESRSAEPLPGAFYHTELTFVGRGEAPALLHLRFDNRTDSVSIRLRYRGWFGGEQWTELIDHRDSLPVPRAAWRILPTGPVRIVAGEGGEPSSVILQLQDADLRLDSHGAIGSWNSSTGQRESLRLAELLVEAGAETGLLLARQRARRIDALAEEDYGQYFLLSDTTGNGILLMRDSTSPDAPVTAWTWFDGIEGEWDDAMILTLAASEGTPGRWSFDLPEAGVLGELRGVPPELAEAADDGTGFHAFRVDAALVIEGESWTMSGIGVQERIP